jgi:hypothetical protein
MYIERRSDAVVVRIDEEQLTLRTVQSQQDRTVLEYVTDEEREEYYR